MDHGGQPRSHHQALPYDATLPEGVKLRGRPRRASLCPVTGLSPPQLALLRVVRAQTADGTPTSQLRIAAALGVWRRAVEQVMARLPPGLVSWMKLAPEGYVGGVTIGAPPSVLLMPEGERLLALADRVKADGNALVRSLRSA